MAKEAEVVLTAVIKRTLQDAVENEAIADCHKNEFRKYLSCADEELKSIPFKTVRSLHKVLSSSGSKIYLHELLEGSDVHIPTNEVRQRNPELEARVQKLRAQADEQEYQRMVGNVTAKTNPLDFSIGEDVKAMNRQMTAVFSFIITVGAAFAFGYKASELVMGTPHVASQLISGLTLGMIVFFADLYFLVKHTN